MSRHIKTITGIVLTAGLLSISQIANASPANGKGVTWAKIKHDTAGGLDTVACKGSGPDCDSYQGDMSCSVALPVLCINKSEAKVPEGFDNSNRYNKWSSGHIAGTHPIKGSDLGSEAEASQICENLHGKGWRMAQHHDGWGWAFTAYGNVRDDTRYWINIRDQKNAHCF